jgi:IS30 family transposase
LNYTHLTREERYQIQALRSQRVAIAAIAVHLGRHRSTIDRELARNASERGYDPAKAHTQAKARLSGPDNVRTIARTTWESTERYLRLGLSPEQVSARLRLEGRASPSKESIYLRVYADKAAGAIWPNTSGARRSEESAMAADRSAGESCAIASASTSVPRS